MEHLRPNVQLNCGVIKIMAHLHLMGAAAKV